MEYTREKCCLLYDKYCIMCVGNIDFNCIASGGLMENLTAVLLGVLSSLIATLVIFLASFLWKRFIYHVRKELLDKIANLEKIIESREKELHNLRNQLKSKPKIKKRMPYTKRRR